MAAQGAACGANLGAVKASTLVLITDAEYDLEVSASHVVFADWSQHGELPKQTIAISLVPRENADNDDVCLPLVITVPFTPRFKLNSPAALVSPFMPLLESTCPLEYTVEFIQPHVTESDYAWDNFQDQIVIQTRLSKLVVKLQAVKASSPPNCQSVETRDSGFFFFPQSLPKIKAPSLKLFEYIEKNHRLPSNEHATVSARRPERVSESFNFSKKKSESALAPLRPRSPTITTPISLPALISSPRPSSSSSSRVQTPRLESTSNKPTIAAAEVCNQFEAKAIILKLRARNSTRNGANSTVSPSSAGHESEFSQPPEEPFPESRLDVRTKAELDKFNHLVASAKEGVMKDQGSAKSELDYYRQFLPRAPSESGDTSTPRGVIAPRESSNTAMSSLAPLQVVAPMDRSSSTISAVTTAPIAPAKRAKPSAMNKTQAKLPSLTALCSPVQLGSLCPSSALSEVENNQETSPMRVSAVKGSGTVMKRPQEPRPASQVARPTPPPASQRATVTAASTTSKTVVASATNIKAGGPISSSNSCRAPGPSDNTSSNAKVSSSSASQRNSATKQNQSSIKSSAAAISKITVAKKNQQQKRTKTRDLEAALSDFDDPDPEVDDAPILPDDLGGMRVSHGYGDDNDDEY